MRKNVLTFWKITTWILKTGLHCSWAAAKMEGKLAEVFPLVKNVFWACAVASNPQDVFLSSWLRKIIRMKSEMIFMMYLYTPIMSLILGQKHPLHKKIDIFWGVFYSRLVFQKFFCSCSKFCSGIILNLGKTSGHVQKSHLPIWSFPNLPWLRGSELDPLWSSWCPKSPLQWVQIWDHKTPCIKR